MLLLDACAVLGISPAADYSTAAKAYKRLALIHHPDRNHGDSAAATERFQQIGAAWNICQRHFDNPSWGQVPLHSSNSAFSADDDIPLDEDELRQFYEFMFKETIFGRYSRSKGQRYRYERSGAAGAGVYTFSGGFAQSQARQDANTARQRKENEEYAKRMRELEKEIEAEEKERQKERKKIQADEDRRANALDRAFQAACAGNSAQVKEYVLQHDLDVNAPRKRAKQAQNFQGELIHDTLLHVAASYCDENLVMFLVDRGAKTNALNKNQLTAYHTAIKAGNVDVVKFIIERRGKSFEGFHPSKAALSGRTPLQLAIESGVPAMVKLLVKYATTHDVEKCWKSDATPEAIKLILREKRGFIPPEEALHSGKSSKLTRKEEILREKEERIIEENRRATLKRQRKAQRLADLAARGHEDKIQASKEYKDLDARNYHNQRSENKGIVEPFEKRQEVRMRAEVDSFPGDTQFNARAGSNIHVTNEIQEARAGIETYPYCHTEHSKNATNERKMPLATTNPQTSKGETNIIDRSCIHIQSSSGQRGAIHASVHIKGDVDEVNHSAQEPVEGSVTSGEGQIPVLQHNDLSRKKSSKARPTESTKGEADRIRRAKQSTRDKARHRQMIETRQGESKAFEAQTIAPMSASTAGSTAQPRNAFQKNSSLRISNPRKPSAEMENIQTCIIPDDLFQDEGPLTSVPRVPSFSTLSYNPRMVAPKVNIRLYTKRS